MSKETARIHWLEDEVKRLTAENEAALAANAAAVCAWQEYGRWPEAYGAVPVGRVRWPDGREEDIALRADQITGITRGIMRHVESLLPDGLEMVKAWQNIDRVRFRAEAAEKEVSRLTRELRRMKDKYEAQPPVSNPELPNP